MQLLCPRGLSTAGGGDCQALFPAWEAMASPAPWCCVQSRPCEVIAAPALAELAVEERLCGIVNGSGEGKGGGGHFLAVLEQKHYSD